MNKKEFLEQLQDLLQRDEPLTSEMKLRDLPEWDSLSMMAIAGFFDTSFKQTLDFTDFEGFITVDDLIQKAGISA